MKLVLLVGGICQVEGYSFRSGSTSYMATLGFYWRLDIRLPSLYKRRPYSGRSPAC